MASSSACKQYANAFPVKIIITLTTNCIPCCPTNAAANSGSFRKKKIVGFGSELVKNISLLLLDFFVNKKMSFLIEQGPVDQLIFVARSSLHILASIPMKVLNQLVFVVLNFLEGVFCPISTRICVFHQFLFSTYHSIIQHELVILIVD